MLILIKIYKQKIALMKPHLNAFLILAMTIVFISSCKQQDKSETSNIENTVKEKITLLASYIMDNTQRGFIDTATQKIVSDSVVKANPCQHHLASEYVEWYYPNGVLNIAMKRMADAFGKDEYDNYVSKNYQFIFDHYQLFENCYTPGKRYISYYRENYSPYWQLFMFSELDHCGSMGAGLIDEYKDNKTDRYRQLINKIGDYILNKQVRLDDGTLVRTTPKEYSLWTDDLFMSIPFLVRMGDLTGEDKYFDDAVHQIEQFRNYVFNKEMKIYHHFWISDTVIEPFAYWGRANGWAIMAHAELLTYLPEDHPKREKMVTYFKQHIEGLVALQDESGLWHQLLDKDDSYLETSSTSMFLYAIARGIRKGWLDDSYKNELKKGWEGLVKKIDDKGLLHNICIGTPIGWDAEFYYNRPKSAGDTHGTAAALIAGSEYVLLKKQ
jgi:rhamnogalacturonyl hydrolase YesR